MKILRNQNQNTHSADDKRPFSIIYHSLCTGWSNITFTYPSFGFRKSRENFGIVLYDGPPHGGERNATSP